MATKRLALIAAFAFLLGVGALTATANAYSCTTTCYGSGYSRTCTTNCF
jgi:hypothetical protein